MLLKQRYKRVSYQIKYTFLAILEFYNANQNPISQFRDFTGEWAFDATNTWKSECRKKHQKQHLNCNYTFVISKTCISHRIRIVIIIFATSQY